MRVLVSGYYGYGNVGDEALLQGMVAGLRRRGVGVEVLSGAPAATRALHGVPATHRYAGLVPAVLRADAVVSGGGGLLQDRTSARSLRYYLGVLALARALGRSRLVFAQSVGPLSDRGAAAVARALAGAHVAVRDAPSQALLAGLGVASERVADPALLLPSPTPSGTARPGPAEERPVLLIPRAGQDELNAALSEAGWRLREAGVALAVLDLHPAEDAPAADLLAAALPGAARWHAATPDAALERVAASRYVLSVRLHGLILAAAANVGFAGLVYDPKVGGFLEDAAAPAFERPVDARALADAALRGGAPDAAALRALRAGAERGLDWLAAHIRG